MFVFADHPSIADQFIAELRDVTVQKDQMRFRRNLERLGELMAYEISKSMSFQIVKVKTPLGVASTPLIKTPPVLATILRASLPFHQGFLNYFDRAENAFIGAYRGYLPVSEEFEVEMDYISSPDLSGKTVILMDPMLATGRSLEKVYHALLRFGTPAKTHIAAVLASPKESGMFRTKCRNVTSGWVPSTNGWIRITTLFPVWAMPVIWRLGRKSD